LVSPFLRKFHTLYKKQIRNQNSEIGKTRESEREKIEGKRIYDKINAISNLPTVTHVNLPLLH